MCPSYSARYDWQLDWSQLPICSLQLMTRPSDKARSTIIGSSSASGCLGSDLVFDISATFGPLKSLRWIAEIKWWKNSIFILTADCMQFYNKRNFLLIGDSASPSFLAMWPPLRRGVRGLLIHGRVPLQYWSSLMHTTSIYVCLREQEPNQDHLLPAALFSGVWLTKCPPLSSHDWVVNDSLLFSEYMWTLCKFSALFTPADTISVDDSSEAGRIVLIIQEVELSHQRPLFQSFLVTGKTWTMRLQTYDWPTRRLVLRLVTSAPPLLGQNVSENEHNASSRAPSSWFSTKGPKRRSPNVHRPLFAYRFYFRQICLNCASRYRTTVTTALAGEHLLSNSRYTRKE